MALTTLRLIDKLPRATEGPEMDKLRRPWQHDDMVRMTAPITLLLCAFMISGCSVGLIPFSHELRTRYNLSRAQVACLQYYVSEEIVLERSLADEESSVEGGELIRRGEVAVHRVRVARHAPAEVVADMIGVRQIGSRFGTEQPSPLSFSPRSPGGPSGDDELYLLISDGTPGHQTVSYGDHEHAVVAGIDAYLMIAADAIRTQRSGETAFESVHNDPNHVLTADELHGNADLQVSIQASSDRCMQTRTEYFQTHGQEYEAEEQAEAERLRQAATRHRHHQLLLLAQANFRQLSYVVTGNYHDEILAVFREMGFDPRRLLDAELQSPPPVASV